MIRRVVMASLLHLLLPLLLPGVAAAATAPAPYTFVSYTAASQVNADCERELASQKAEEVRLQQLPATTGGELLAALDTMTRSYEDTPGPMGLLTAVHPDKAIRDATEACDLKYQAFVAAFLQNERIYALLKQVQPADDIDRRYQRDLLDGFEDAGVGLPPEPRKRAQDLTNEMSRLTQDFERRVREDKTQVAFTAAELKGVPDKVWNGKARDASGRYLLGMDYPTYLPVMETALDAKTRERMWRAYQSRAGADNLKTLSQLADLRREYAALFGQASYADFVLRRRMAEREVNVQAFLGSVEQAVRPREVSDLAMLRAAKAKDLKTPLAKTVLNRWDLVYYTERVRKAKYAVDQEQFRAYFPPEASLDLVFRLMQQLFGVSFAPLQQSLWHADARAFEVSDSDTKALLGTLFVDLYPRADKFNHAAVWSFRSVSTLVGRQPAAGLVVNFNRQGLTLDELETLLHEFGHAVHGLVSNTRYAGQGGTSVQRDFVEAPSQMLEEWVYDPRVLALFQQVCSSCKPVPTALLVQADKARQFGKGLKFARQHLYASYDLAVHGRSAQDPMALWATMEGATPVGHVQGTMFPAAFGHIAGGYAAGYYGYLWSLVLAEDLRTAFAADKLDGTTGRRYRAAVISRGGERAPSDLVQQFLGRPGNSKAFFTSLNK